MLAHEGYLWVGKQATAVSRGTRDDETISFLPLNHVYEQIFDLMIHLTIGHIVNFIESTDTVTDNMREISPTVFHAVPRVWEKYYSGIMIMMSDATWVKQAHYQTALRIGEKYAALKPSIHRFPALCSRLSAGLFRHLPETEGAPGLRPGPAGFSGAAPISPDVLRFFQASAFPSGKVTG